VLAVGSDDVVVPAPSDAQSRLEGAVFHGLGYLHAVGGYPDDYRIHRLLPTEHALEVWLTKHSDGFLRGLVGALPTWYPEDRVLANGHPGLRYRSIRTQPDTVEFFLLHEQCAVRVHGVDVAAFEDACAVHDPEEDLQADRTGHTLSAAELGELEHRDRRVDALISPLIRRLGALGTDEVRSIDLWRTHPDVLSVEKFTADRSERTFRRLLADLISPHLRPQMTVVKTDGAAGYRTVFRVDGHTAQLHLRVQSS